ncbi:hypothetical protein [Mucilaginibacter sp.]|uniref:hypothetical protein n=1 Tax=Mucilaginibacter sp. TaxID=1882438 RepID=UPI002635449A|nr:hypothetical protein [Mucilaginibacter sp.]MDB4919839.1 hypothetical protein [Mucilaginibacter sp.]
MAADYANIILTGLQHVDGNENPSGIQEDVFIMIVSQMATIAEPAASPTAPEAMLTIAGPHVMATGKSPFAVYSMFEKSDFESPMAGEVYSKIFMPDVTCFIPQPTPENAGNFSVLKNSRLIVLIKRTQGGAGFTQIGSKHLSAKIKDGSVKYGKGPTGEPGITFNIEAPSIHPFYYYTGILPVTGV